MPIRRLLLAAAALTVPATAAAHGFGRLYNLPVPLWLYAWGAAAVLAVSFMIAALFAAAPAPAPATASRDLGDTAFAHALRRMRPALQVLSVGLLLLCIATGLFGNRDPYRNFSMTFFWIVFLLLFTYLTALFGNFYAAVNPWRVVADAIGRFARGFTQGRVRYPERLGDWPALALYLGFIWFELYNHGHPATLAWMLLAYSVLNLAGVWWVGAAAWFRHGEFFSVFLRLIGLMAPRGGRLLGERPTHASTVVFALAMLSTTAFDGLRATQWWVNQFWIDYSGIVTRLAGGRPLALYAELRPWYIGWETLWLLASPFLYFAAYLGALALAKLLTRSRRPLKELALDFGYALLPIALVYHLTHYATLVLTQGPKIVSLFSDPFGWGWNLFGTAGLLRVPILPPMGLVWHSQVALIVFGHMQSVYVGHRIALRVWPDRRAALVSQLPLLGLMVAFTVAGLWILAQPLTAMLMR